MCKQLFRQRFTRISIYAVLAFAMMSCCGEDVSAPKVEESLTQIPFQEVALEDEFWLPRLQNLSRYYSL